MLSQIAFSDKELTTIQIAAQNELSLVTDRRNKDLEDLYRQLNKAFADLDFLTKDKLNLLRTGVFSSSQVIEEEARLNTVIENIQARINANSESSQAMLDYVITFSNLVKDAAAFFTYALEAEKRNFVIQVFSELSIVNGELKYVAKEAFEVLLKRFDDQNWQSGSANYLFLELAEITRKTRPVVELLVAFNARLS